MKLSDKTKQIIITTLTLVALLFVVIDAALFTTRCDFTKDNTYTISKVTKKTFKELEDRVRISFYISDKVIQQRPYAQTTIDLLEEIASASRKNVELKIVHLNSKNVSKYQQEMAGIQPWQIQMSDGKSSASVDVVYSGLTIAYKEKKEVIPVLQEYNYQQIEYEIVSRVRKMAYDYELKIGLINASNRPTTPIQQQEEIFNMGYNALFEQSSALFEDFSFEKLELGAKIDNKYTAVVVVGAEQIDEQQVLIFDQYLMRGGSIFFAVEQGPLVINPMNQYNPITVSDLSDNPIMPFFKHFGIAFEEGKLMDVNAKQTLAQAAPGQLTVVPVVFQPRMVQANKNYPFHSNFNGIGLYWPEALKVTYPEKVDGEKMLQIDTLLSSSRASALAPNSDPRSLWEPAAGVAVYNSTAKEMRKSFPVAVHVHGLLNSYFADKEQPQKAGEDPLYKELVKATDVGQFILLADTEFVSDFLFSEGQDGLIQNLNYLRNVAEYLGGDRELLQVRTKIPGVRLLTEDAKTLDTISIVAIVINLAVVPLLIIAFAISWLVVRKKRTK